jgi:hypothetical protein
MDHAVATLSTNPRINDQGALLTHLFDLASAFPRCGVVVAALALSQVSNLFSPVIMGKAIDILSLGSRGVRTLGILLLSLLGITVSAQFSNYIYKRQLAESMQAFEKNIRLRLWDGLAKISVGEYESMPRGSLQDEPRRLDAFDGHPHCPRSGFHLRHHGNMGDNLGGIPATFDSRGRCRGNGGQLPDLLSFPRTHQRGYAQGAVCQ